MTRYERLLRRAYRRLRRARADGGEEVADAE